MLIHSNNNSVLLQYTMYNFQSFTLFLFSQPSFAEFLQVWPGLKKLRKGLKQMHGDFCKAEFQCFKGN